jgi:hypothetical protein
MDLAHKPRHIIRNADSKPIEKMGKYQIIAEQFRIIKSWESQTNVYITSFCYSRLKIRAVQHRRMRSRQHFRRFISSLRPVGARAKSCTI